MAKPDGTTVVRYWPVEEANNNYLQPTSIGLSIRLKRKPKLTPRIEGVAYALALSHGGSLLVACHGSGKNISVFNASDLTKATEIPQLPGTSRGAAFSPDDSYLAVAHSGGRKLTVFSTELWNNVSGLPAIAGEVRDVSFSSNGSILAVGHSSSPRITMINTSTWAKIASTPTITGTVNGVDFNPTKPRLAAAHAGSPCLTVFNTSGWAKITGTPVLPGTGYCAVFSPDGEYLAVGHSGGSGLTIINATTWAVVPGTPQVDGVAMKVAFTPDGEYLIVASGYYRPLMVIRTSDWSSEPRPDATENYFYGVAVSSDSQRVFTGFGIEGLSYANINDLEFPSEWPVLPNDRVSAYIPDYNEGFAVLRSGPVYSAREWQDFIGVVTVGVPSDDLEYSETEFSFLDEGGEVEPISFSDFPLDVYLFKEGRVGGEWFGGNGYAGGVIQVGMYNNGEFVELAAFQFAEQYFHDAKDGEWERVPQPTFPTPVKKVDGYPDDMTDYVMLSLNASFTTPAFWTGLQRSVELLRSPSTDTEEIDPPPDPGDEDPEDPGDAELPDTIAEGWDYIILTAEEVGDWVGFASVYGERQGDAVPDTLSERGVEATIRDFTSSSDRLYLEVAGVYGVTGITVVVGESVLFLSADYNSSGVIVINHSLDGPIFEDGGVYDVYIYLHGDLRSEP